MQDIINQINEVISIQVLLPIIIIQLLIMVVALFSWFRSETKGPKWLWLILIIFVTMIGPVLYFILGRKND